MFVLRVLRQSPIVALINRRRLFSRSCPASCSFSTTATFLPNRIHSEMSVQNKSVLDVHKHHQTHGGQYAHIDVRSTAELLSDGFIPGMTHHAPLDQLARHNLPSDPSHLVIFSCLGGGRSLKAATQAIAWGHHNGTACLFV
jgi:rhodanese-related sulfurtransferase